ncbi:hypothetical protein OF001_U180112 [Pseudomonas sp. OF001]|nr:hypothetical protein OF001_U180112 [Pseudomonas sp. OF001]
MRARGLKLERPIPLAGPCLVAPHAGAWIETIDGQCGSGCTVSRPTRLRGLKQAVVRATVQLIGFAPRLKHRICERIAQGRVRKALLELIFIRAVGTSCG